MHKLMSHPWVLVVAALVLAGAGASSDVDAMIAALHSAAAQLHRPANAAPHATAQARVVWRGSAPFLAPEDILPWSYDDASPLGTACPPEAQLLRTGGLSSGAAGCTDGELHFIKR